MATRTRGAATMSKGSEAVKNYYRENCTEFKIRQAKEEAQAVKDYATAHGCSVQALFLAAVADYMAQGKTPAEVKRGRKKGKQQDPAATTHPAERGERENENYL